MNKLSDTIIYALTSSRYRSGLSQEEIAHRLGVSKKTVQNWESGIACPRLDQSIEWFRSCNLQPMPYFMDMLHQDTCHPSHLDPDSIRTALHSIIDDFTADQQLQILYFMRHAHGSSPAAVLDLINAHLQSPLISRLNVAAMVLNNYDLAKATGNLVSPESIQPDMNRLRSALREATRSVIDGNSEYDLLGGNDNG